MPPQACNFKNSLRAIVNAFTLTASLEQEVTLDSSASVFNLWIMTPFGSQMNLSQQSHIRYPAYQTFTLQLITAAKLQL